ncbi:hypothetical protein V5P93_007082 [Actinokineospora auranticolor]|uniref:Uncharacterized protein n=1 Tax=Actinokineospora auranticolor TaxID=155976 RepID=A0A2S6GGW5_9PSEU|nr:hypothetical protein [Actinokineospora auranticolor]PPK64467.1 hypothetical protein CLV40_11931 [Actinokineospora auranticolor]
MTADESATKYRDTLYNRPQTTRDVLHCADRTESWPHGVPSLVDDLKLVIKCANDVLSSIIDEDLDDSAVDSLDSVSYRVIESCRWLQIHR